MKNFFSNIMFLMLLVGFVGGSYAGYLYGFPQYRAYVFKKDVEELERIIYPEHSKLASIKAKITKQMKEDEVPIDMKKLDEHMKVVQEGTGLVRVDIKYSVHVDFFGYFPREYDFEVEFAK